MFGSSVSQVQRIFREWSNLRFAPSTSLTEIATRLDRAYYNAMEVGITVDQLKLPFVDIVKSLLQSHRRVEPSVMPF
ncbi:hypothetical protein BLA29_014651, partial [Euroglyphus maynei]